MSRFNGRIWTDEELARVERREYLMTLAIEVTFALACVATIVLLFM